MVFECKACVPCLFKSASENQHIAKSKPVILMHVSSYNYLQSMISHRCRINKIEI